MHSNPKNEVAAFVGSKKITSKCGGKCLKCGKKDYRKFECRRTSKVVSNYVSQNEYLSNKAVFVV